MNSLTLKSQRNCADKDAIVREALCKIDNNNGHVMKTLQACKPRQAVLDGTADFVVNLADLPKLTEEEAKEFLDSNVLTLGMEFLLMQAFSRLAGIGSASGLYKLSEAMGGGKTQSMIVAGILARFPHLASMLPFQKPLPEVVPDVVVSFMGRATDKKVWVSLGAALGAIFPPDRAPSRGRVARSPHGAVCAHSSR